MAESFELPDLAEAIGRYLTTGPTGTDVRYRVAYEVTIALEDAGVLDVTVFPRTEVGSLVNRGRMYQELATCLLVFQKIATTVAEQSAVMRLVKENIKRLRTNALPDLSCFSFDNYEFGNPAYDVALVKNCNIMCVSCDVTYKVFKRD